MSVSHGLLRRVLAALVCVVSVAAGFALAFRSSASDVLPNVPTPQLLGLLALMALPGCVLMLARADRAAQRDAAAKLAATATTTDTIEQTALTSDIEQTAAANAARGVPAVGGDAREHAPTRPGEDSVERHRRRSDLATRPVSSRTAPTALRRAS